jgi:hypothetical protein
MVRPCRSAAIQSAFGTRTPGEDDVARKIDRGEIGQFTVSGLHDSDIGELQLFDDIDHPILAEGFPSEHIDAARA